MIMVTITVTMVTITVKLPVFTAERNSSTTVSSTSGLRPNRPIKVECSACFHCANQLLVKHKEMFCSIRLNTVDLYSGAAGHHR